MHRVLLVQEILALVFTYVAADRSQIALRDLAHLARTCKTFRDPALDVLWYELESTLPLFRLLPLKLYVTPGEGSQNTTHCWAFRRHVVDEDWKTFSLYASRVRHLRQSRDPARDPEIAASSLQSVAITRPMVTFLPHLFSLEWRGTYDMGILNAAMFVSPSLQRLRIDARERPQALHTLFQIVASRAPKLSKATVHYSSPDTGCVLSSKGLVDRLVHLTKVDFSAVNTTPHILIDLASLPSLRQLSITTLNLVESVDVIFPPAGFPLLESLDVALPAELCTRLLCSSQIKFLRSARIYPNGEGEIMTNADIQSLVAAACAPQRASTLSTLVIEPFHKLEPEDPSKLESNPGLFNVTLASLLPILSMRALTTLHIKTGYTFNMKDADIDTLAQALPNLRYLHLGSPHAISPRSLLLWESMPTLEALASVARHCPNLKDLALCLDVTGDNLTLSRVCEKWVKAEGDNRIPQPLVLSALEKLHVGTSPIHCGAATGVASFLAELCPSLCHLTWMGGRGCWEAGRSKAAKVQSVWQVVDTTPFKAWGTVVNVLPYIQAGRMEEGGGGVPGMRVK